ncbi:lysophospholipid acyltransferase family protein [Sinomicrobium weinanense]|uniref:1-acyl-sn-glycerol-3-phosphate acyltransferase n=1 Tax=Sinomicrobium weinanense TaxID=2842200 RepID=A0A926JNE0_9FLAO|nr:lysophospholipid acyltransferase family protein [Sinomicrobium weinanense]MBC9794369.1 1-acyl-sn-glycerol-3-phosphate acyltransferase [Sinomicrobium weinanense]MBU3124276.1 1-acyl-sn-glycerol-3-phosphate acyltransferase [Sinomicrobium weinanense]
MMKLLKYPFLILWRIWFYVLMAGTIIPLSPAFLILTSSDKYYHQFFWLVRNVWANIILYGMGFYPRIQREQNIEKGKSYVLIANHTSMADIMLMLKVSRNPFVFVGKKELTKIPIFGFFYKRVCIIVDRNSIKSRTEVYDRARKRLEDGLSICIFPEGGVPEEEVFLDEFKDGAFRLAIAYQIPLVPMTFADNKKRFPYVFFKGSPGIMRVKVHPFIETKGFGLADRGEVKAQAREVIYRQLCEYRKEKEK